MRSVINTTLPSKAGWKKDLTLLSSNMARKMGLAFSLILWTQWLRFTLSPLYPPAQWSVFLKIVKETRKKVWVLKFVNLLELRGSCHHVPKTVMIKPMFVQRQVCYSASLTSLVRWHAGVVSLPPRDVILAQLACPPSDVMFWLHSGIINLSPYKHWIQEVHDIKNFH